MCKALTEVQLNSGLEALGFECFADTKLKKIEIPENITEIPEKAFSECMQLQSVEFAPGSHCATIGEKAFNMSGIVCFRAPANLRVIEPEAFG